MKKSLIIYREGLRYELDLREDRPVLIASKESAQLYLEGLAEDLTLQLTDGQIYYQYGDQLGQIKAGSQIEDMTFYPGVEEVTVYDLLDLKEIRISDKPGATIPIEGELDLLLQKEGKSWRLTRLGGTFYRNNVLETDNQLVLGFGDELSLYGLTLKVYPDELWLRGLEAPQLSERQPSRYAFYPDYPDYHRSPRIIYRGSEDKIQINPPGKEPNKPSDELLKLIVPPLLMMGMVILITLIQPRGIYILATMAMSLASVVFSVRGFIKNRKKYRADLKERIDLYHLYLRDKAKELAKLERDQREGLLYHFPGIEELTRLVARYDHRIYEKTPLHYDFLAYRLGLGQVLPSYQLTYGQMERSGQKDALEEEGYALYSRHRKLDNLPIPASLNRVPVGYIGPRPLVLEQLQLLVMELATFHSYHDLQLITVLPEEELPDWQWMRWLPHAKLQELNVRGFVYNQRTRDQVLNSLNQILKLRKSQSQEVGHQESTLFSPHYVVLITDTSLILDHVIMEFFRENPTNLGCSLVFVEDVLSSLSENIKTVIQIKDRNTGQLVMEEGVLRETDFRLDHFPEGYDKEKIARTLAPLHHIQNLKSSIPETVTFLEMYGAETFIDLQVLKRWGQNAPYRSLAVPIGLRGKDDLVQLNLHEKAHGPHGLIAGTTGSGKSETLQSYILSLAVNFHPHDVGFLLIDYKGGGMAHLFKKLPHLLGTITNLDGAQSMRALVSINAEIHRRERIFNRYEVNHINQYQKKVKAGEAVEPLPHLFLISDEFAELKANQPDFMKELVSIARVGRSLGIHLILATQKPSGVVDDQIWSNSRFKLALKVADRSDSMEMLHTPDAAEITQTGRAYLQVVNNEVYELFQSAWSGADYQPDKDELGIEDHTIYRVNELGQYEVLNQDLSGLEEIDEIKEVPTELDAIVSHLHELSQDIAAVPQPWLPPLRERIYLPDLRPETYQESWAQTKGTLKALLGMVDLPKKQAQALVWHDFEVDGNMVIFSAPGMGKSTLLQTIVMDLARHNRPDQLEVYLFDFGTNGLLPMRELPHVADTIALDDDEKITKFILRMKNLVADRKQAFKRYGASNMATYRKASGEELAQVLIVIDSYDGVREIELGNDLEALFQTLTREGSGLGIYLVFTASRIGVFKPGLLSTIKERIALKMTDDNEPRSLVGRHDYIMEDIPGRGLKKLDEAEIFQTALPTQGEDPFTLLQHLQEEAQAMDEAWTGQRPRPIPVVPEKLEFEHFVEKDSVQSALSHGEFPIGLDLMSVENSSVPISKLKHLLFMGDTNEAIETMMSHLLQTSLKVPNSQVMLIDSEQIYTSYQDQVSTYVGESDEVARMVDQLGYDIEQRLATGNTSDWFIFIPNLESFVIYSKMTETQIRFLFERASQVGFHLILGGDYQILGTKIDAVFKYMRLNAQWILFGMRLNDQNFLDKGVYSRDGYPAPDEVYLHSRKQVTKLKISR